MCSPEAQLAGVLLLALDQRPALQRYVRKLALAWHADGRVSKTLCGSLLRRLQVCMWWCFLCVFVSFVVPVSCSPRGCWQWRSPQDHGPGAGGWALLQEAAAVAPAAIPSAQLLEAWTAREPDNAAVASSMLSVLAAVAPRLAPADAASLTGQLRVICFVLTGLAPACDCFAGSVGSGGGHGLRLVTVSMAPQSNSSSRSWASPRPSA